VSTDNLDGYNGIGTVNIQGEDQKKLDVIANRIMKTALCCSGQLSVVASEEEDDVCVCSTVTDNVAFDGNYAAVFDPLDGSSNVDVGLPTGTIFGVYRDPKFQKSQPINTIKQCGNQLAVAGYCLFSSATHMAISITTGLHIFTLDDVTGEFFLTKSNVKIPRFGPLYSFNDANSHSWDPAIQYYLNDLKDRKLSGYRSEEKPSARYMGALVADVHNIITKGGIFGYPKSKSSPNGKLRIVYEANPLSFIVEEAGGRGSNGKERILDVDIENIHQRTPLFIGSIDNISILEKYIKFYDQ
jgi:fructose-1,6-bisphosphatase I